MLTLVLLHDDVHSMLMLSGINFHFLTEEFLTKVESKFGNEGFGYDMNHMKFLNYSSKCVENEIDGSTSHETHSSDLPLSVLQRMKKIECERGDCSSICDDFEVWSSLT
jgi:hypothetical protein